MNKIALFMLLLVILLGCSPLSNNADSISTATSIADISIQSSPTSQPSPTASVASTQPIPEISTDCVDITPVSEDGLGGTLVFQKGLGDQLIFVENRTRNQKYVPADPSMKVWQAYVSPDGKWLIYELDWGDPNGETKFVLTKADGLTQKEIPNDGYWGASSIFWLNNSNLRVTETDNGVTYIDNFAYNPFTGKESALRSELPDVTYHKNIDWHIDQQAYELGVLTGTNLIYDPTLTRVLYPKSSDSVSLFNLETNQEITRQSVPGWGRLPKWSSGGRSLAIISSMSSSLKREALDEFLIVSRDGPEFQRLTYLTSVFKSVHIEDYNWSPDGNQIAFWLQTDNNKLVNDQNPFELAVLDLKTGNIINYCIAGISTVEYETYTMPANIVWSPDSTQLLITRHKDDNKQTEVLVVDLMNKTAYKVTENMQPIGWMTREP